MGETDRASTRVFFGMILVASIAAVAAASLAERLWAIEHCTPCLYQRAPMTRPERVRRRPGAQPLSTDQIRSSFGSRTHPILGDSRLHTGVDWAAPRGTPIYAGGNGVVENSGWEEDIASIIRIRHPSG